MLSLTRPVSIEIGSQSVKVAQLIERRGRIRVIRFAERELPAGFRWEVGGDRGPLVQAVKAALAEAGIHTGNAIFMLPRRQVTARIGAFPPAEREDLRRVVEYDLADHIPFPVQQVVVDFQQLGPSPDQPGLIEVLVVAAPRELVRDYLRLAEELRLRVTALTVDALALHDLGRVADGEPPGLGLVLEIGARATTINVSELGKLRLMRSVAIGGNQLTRAIQDDFGVSPAEAEHRKRTDGLELLRREPRPAAMQAWLDNLVGELRRSALSFGPGVLSRILLTGGGAAVPGLADRLEAEFGVEPIVLGATSLFADSELWGRDPATADRCLLAMAGALRAIGRSAWTVSLLPAELVQERRARRLRQLAALGVMAVLALMVTLYLAAAGEAGKRQTLVTDLKQRSKAVAKQRNSAEKVIAERDRLRAQAEALQIVRVRRYAALELLRTIDFYAPKEVVLTHFTLRPDQPLELRGAAPNPGTVADLQHALEQSPLVREASMTTADRTTARGQAGEKVNFTLQLKLWTQQEPEPRAASLRPGGQR